MAGVGFELNRILSRQGYTALLQAYGYAGLIGSGPWLVAVITLQALGVLMAGAAPPHDLRIFFVSVSLAYAITLILSGPIQMVLTRFTADQHFTGSMEAVFPTFVLSLAWTAAGFALAGFPVIWFLVPGSPLFRSGLLLLVVLVSSTWVAGVFLTALKNYLSVLGGFLVGFLASLVLAAAGCRWHGVDAAMLGFAGGQGILLLILCGVIFRELGSMVLVRADFGGAFVKYWDLALGGLLYNLSIWIDKFIYWWVDPRAERIGGILRASPMVDNVVYFSFLTIIPGMAVFLLKLETEFAMKNERFFQLVLRKGTLAQIGEAQTEMVLALRDGFVTLVKVQGLVTALLVLLSDSVVQSLHFAAVQTTLLQVSLVAVYFLVLFLALMTVLYYLDKRTEALWMCGLMTLLNGGITLALLPLGEAAYGFGFLVANAVVVAVGTQRVNHHLRRLDYHTFTSQPLYG